LNDPKKFTAQRREMVDQQIRTRGVSDERVLKAMAKVPREQFIPDPLRIRAYDDHPLPIADGQTISQPYIVALMTELAELTGNEKVLEIGTGSGYQAAILAELAERVFSIERNKKLAWAAEKVLPELGYHNVLIRVADGTHGWLEEAPYDAIIVTAGAPEIPQALVDQLADGGRLIIPVGDEATQTLYRVRYRYGRTKTEQHGSCRFVKLIGRYGWND
jgi:protein-L-isoaspartate(D-aspartate) O-methyltransferase